VIASSRHGTFSNKNGNMKNLTFLMHNHSRGENEGKPVWGFYVATTISSSDPTITRFILCMGYPLYVFFFYPRLLHPHLIYSLFKLFYLFTIKRYQIFVVGLSFFLRKGQSTEKLWWLYSPFFPFEKNLNPFFLSKAGQSGSKKEFRSFPSVPGDKELLCLADVFP
jgi:hypothetical protein